MSEPDQMSDFEKIALQLLESIDRRLKSIDEAVDFFRRLQQAQLDDLANRARWRPPGG